MELPRLMSACVPPSQRFSRCAVPRSGARSLRRRTSVVYVTCLYFAFLKDVLRGLDVLPFGKLLWSLLKVALQGSLATLVLKLAGFLSECDNLNRT